MFENPILPGFHPDPSIVRVDDDFYMATSTFEWLPAVKLHHSKDAQHWTCIGYAITENSQINLQHVQASCGVWAPCLSYDASAKRFYLCYSIVHKVGRAFDVDNVLHYSDAICGPWSAPVYLNSSGFDPSLFHDDDGRKWLVNLKINHRDSYNIGPLLLTEWDPSAQKLVGETIDLFVGATNMGCLEGAHIYKRNDYYYLLCAEGGTGYGHAVTMARSRILQGPYEAHPDGPIITAASKSLTVKEASSFMRPECFNPDAPLQKTGHASMAPLDDDHCIMPFLCARPLVDRDGLYCPLGREAGACVVRWDDDGWLRSVSAKVVPIKIAHDALPEIDWMPPVENSNRFNAHCWNSVRHFADASWLNTADDGKVLQLRGGPSLTSARRPSLLARRVCDFHFSAKVCLLTAPTNDQEEAGMVLYYDASKYLALTLCADAEGKCFAAMQIGKEGKLEYTQVVSLETSEAYALEIEYANGYANLMAAVAGSKPRVVASDVDAAFVSDEGPGQGHFTGAFIGLFATDMKQKERWFTFEDFVYASNQMT